MPRCLSSINLAARSLSKPVGTPFIKWKRPRYVLYKDRDIVVVDKPRAVGCKDTVALLTSQKVRRGLGFKTRPGERNVAWGGKFLLTLLSGARVATRLKKNPIPVYSLPREVTGVLVLARGRRNVEFVRSMYKQFKTGQGVLRTFLALVRGTPKSFPAPFGKIRTYLKDKGFRVEVSRIQAVSKDASDKPSQSSGVVPPGQMRGRKKSQPKTAPRVVAETRWEVIASSRTVPLSLVRLSVNTYHRDQIRAHLAHVLHTPILGDPVYSTTPPSPKISAAAAIPPHHLFLHASHTNFLRPQVANPTKLFRMGFTAPLPPFFVKFCKSVEIALPERDINGGAFVYRKGKKRQQNLLNDLGGKWLRRSHLMFPRKTPPESLREHEVDILRTSTSGLASASAQSSYYPMDWKPYKPPRGKNVIIDRPQQRRRNFTKSITYNTLESTIPARHGSKENAPFQTDQPAMYIQKNNPNPS